MKFHVYHAMGKEPPLPGAVLVTPATLKNAADWTVEVSSLDQLIELAQDATIALIRPALHPTRREKAQGKPEFGDLYLMVDYAGKRFQQR